MKLSGENGRSKAHEKRSHDGRRCMVHGSHSVDAVDSPDVESGDGDDDDGDVESCDDDDDDDDDDGVAMMTTTMMALRSTRRHGPQP